MTESAHIYGNSQTRGDIMKAKKIFAYIILISVILTSCKANHTNTFEENVDFSELSVKNLPSMEEFHSWDIKTKREFKSEIEHISPSDCEDYFSAEVTEFLQAYPGIELFNLAIEQDHLSLIAGKNKKSLFNLIFKIDITLDTTNNLECYDLSDDVSRDLIAFLQQYSYYLLKTKEIDINTLDQNGYIIHNLNNTYSISNETMFTEQPNDEYSVQTLAFEFFNNSSDLQLQKFGIIPEKEILLVEYRVSDDYFDFNKLEENKKELENKSIKLKDYLLSQNETKSFIQTNHVNHLVISFYNGIFDESTLSFSYEL